MVFRKLRRLMEGMRSSLGETPSGTLPLSTASALILGEGALGLNEARNARERVARGGRGGFPGDEGVRLAFDLDELDRAAASAIDIGEAVGPEVLDIRI